MNSWEFDGTSKIDLGQIIFIVDTPYDSATNHNYLEDTVLKQLNNYFEDKDHGFQVEFKIEIITPGCIKARIRVIISGATTLFILTSAIIGFARDIEYVKGLIDRSFKENKTQIEIIDQTIKRTVQVKQGDTLFAIAQATKHNSCTTEQFMLALLQMNPKAFYRNNINCLSEGEQLMIPIPDAIKFISRDYAKVEVERQNKEFKVFNA